MQYFGMSFNSFISKLRMAMSDRLGAFEKYMNSEFQKDPERTSIKSKKQWMYEYKNWITKDATVEKEILKYLMESEQK